MDSNFLLQSAYPNNRFSCEDNFSTESFNIEYITHPYKKLFFIMNNEIIKIKKTNIFNNLLKLRSILNLALDYSFTFNYQNIKQENESDITIKDIIFNNNYIALMEQEINIKISIENIKNVYIVKISNNKTLSELRENLKIKNKYKFLSQDDNFILLLQEGKFKIKDILINNSEIHLKEDELKEDSFSEKEINLIQDYYYFRFNKKIYKIKLNHDDLLSDIRKKINFTNLNNYVFADKEGEIISKDDESIITINSISLVEKGNNNFYVNLIEINMPIQKSEYIKTKNNLKIYKYPKIIIDKSHNKEYKTLMFIGETGSGKTTLINCFVNYLMEIKQYDDFRYIIVDEEHIKNEGHSHTSDINVYYIYPSNNDEFPIIKLIDTPGFADTREEFDFEIIKKFKKFFENERSIDLICFVMKSTVTRNTEYQRYIISTIIGLFGKDLISNFIILFTFCDLGKPLFLRCLNSKDNPLNKILKYISEPSYISFNNSAIFSGKNKYLNSYWDISYNGFYTLLEKVKNINIGSLYLTREVISIRDSIFLKCEKLNEYLDNCLEIHDILQKCIKKLKEQEHIIEKNKDCILIEQKEEIKKINTECGIHNINCIKCNTTCHKQCEEIKDGDVLKCGNFKNCVCQICGCSNDNHCDLPYFFSKETKKNVIKNIKKEKELYNSQIKFLLIKSDTELKIKELKSNFELANNSVLEIEKDFENLNNISLLSNIYETQEKFVDYKINFEKTSKEKDYLKKIKIYEKYKKTFNRLNNIYMKNNVFLNLNELEKDFNEKNNAILEKITDIFINIMIDYNSNK